MGLLSGCGWWTSLQEVRWWWCLQEVAWRHFVKKKQLQCFLSYCMLEQIQLPSHVHTLPRHLSFCYMARRRLYRSCCLSGITCWLYENFNHPFPCMRDVLWICCVAGCQNVAAMPFMDNMHWNNAQSAHALQTKMAQGRLAERRPGFGTRTWALSLLSLICLNMAPFIR